MNYRKVNYPFAKGTKEPKQKDLLLYIIILLFVESFPDNVPQQKIATEY